jgi:tyrosine aminotransferase
LDEGSVLLVPRPGFPLYQVIAESHGARVRHYDLLPDRGWEVDLDHVRRIVEEEELSAAGKVVRGIVVNNPSNPTGAVYSREHLREIVALAGRHKVPIVADEIYGDMTFDDAAFRPMAEVAAQLGREVPVIAASGLGKQYLVPGWRVGWIVFHDNRHGSLRQVKEGARRLAQVVLGASHLAQVAVPAVLDPPSDEGRSSVATWKAELYRTVEKQAKLLCGMLDYECRGLDVISPQGAMYAMVRIDVDAFDDYIVDDVSFMGLLLEEENVVVLPGRAFGLGQGDDAKGGDNAHAFRVAFCAPKEVLREAAGRIASFCFRHARK